MFHDCFRFYFCCRTIIGIKCSDLLSLRSLKRRRGLTRAIMLGRVLATTMRDLVKLLVRPVITVEPGHFRANCTVRKGMSKAAIVEEKPMESYNSKED